MEGTRARSKGNIVVNCRDDTSFRMLVADLKKRSSANTGGVKLLVCVGFNPRSRGTPNRSASGQEHFGLRGSRLLSGTLPCCAGTFAPAQAYPHEPARIVVPGNEDPSKMTPNTFTALVLSSVAALALPSATSAQTDPSAGSIAASTDASTVDATAAKMATPAPEMKLVLDKLAELGAKPLHVLTVDEARAQPTPADAVAAVMAEKKTKAGPAATIATRDIIIPGPAGDIPARVYMPEGAGPFPVIVYYHGGGWVIADIDTYDASARALSLGTGAVVVSSHYRQGPENVFPAAHEDAYAAYVWSVESSGELNGDAARMAVAGESAGANLAANVAIMARDAKITQPLHQLLVYPVAGTDMNTPSYVENAEAAPLGKADMAWFVEHAFAKKEDAADPRINLVDRNDLTNLPAATVITAQIDPLRSESIAYGEALRAAGVPVEMKTYDGVTHEFFGMGDVVPQAKEAMDFATASLKAAFGN